MALVNQTIPGLFGGVSQQAPELRHDTQVSEMINCIPTVVGGVQKRRPSELVYTDSELPSDCFVYSYDRGAGNETYIMFINNNGELRVFDLVNNSWATSWTSYDYLTIPAGASAIDSFALTTVGDTTFIVNKTIECSSVETIDDNGDPNWDKNFYYWVSRTAGDAEANADLRYTYYIRSDDPAYSGVCPYLNNQGNLTVDDPTFSSSFVGLSLHNITQGWMSKIITATTTVLETETTTETFEIGDEYEIIIAATSHDSTDVVRQLAQQVNGIADPNYTAYTSGSVLKIVQGNGNKLYGSDSWGNQASSAWQGKINKLQDLPSDFGFEGAVVEVAGDDKNSFDNYYVKYEDGVWLETFKPNIANALDISTLPHKITREAGGSFLLASIDYNNRNVGDEATASLPSFVGNTIADVFFFKNRLGFIANDNVIMSEAGEFYNFFPTTLTAVLDSDPIDVAVDTNKAVSLHYALPFNKELLIFGDKAQFILSSNDVLTPNSVSVQQSTSFDTTKATPVSLGPSVYFVVEKNNYSNVLEYFVQQDTVTNDASNITAHCPNYLPVNIKKIVGAAASDMVFALSTEENNTIYVYNFYWNGEEKAQSAWHKWTVDGVINNIEIINNELILFITRTGSTNSSLESIKLDTITDFDSILYRDVGVTSYESLITLSEVGFASGNVQVDDKRNKFMLKNMQVNSDYGSIYNVKVNKYNKPRVFSHISGSLKATPEYKDVVIQTRDYDCKVLSGPTPSDFLLPSDTLLPGAITYLMNSDNRYMINGNTKNLEINIYNNIDSGFKINSINFLGSFINKARSV